MDQEDSFTDQINKTRKNTFSFKPTIPTPKQERASQPEVLNLNSLIEATSTWAHMDKRATSYLKSF